jgi:hypothetical protein
VASIGDLNQPPAVLYLVEWVVDQARRAWVWTVEELQDLPRWRN